MLEPEDGALAGGSEEGIAPCAGAAELKAAGGGELGIKDRGAVGLLPPAGPLEGLGYTGGKTALSWLPSGAVRTLEAFPGGRLGGSAGADAALLTGAGEPMPGVAGGKLGSAGRPSWGSPEGP